MGRYRKRWAEKRRLGNGRTLRALMAVLCLLGVSGGAFEFFMPAGADGNTLYVSSNGNDSGDCSSSSSPCATISYALTQANPGYTIEVAGTIDDDPDITQPVTISQMPGGAPAVVIGDASGSVFTISMKGPNQVTLDGLTIENGQSQYGGGITNFGTLTMTNSTIADNTATDGGEGGGIQNNGTLDLVDSTISDNTVIDGGQGGGLYNNGTVTVTNSTISANSAEDGGQGGGVDNNGTLSVTGSTLSENTTSSGGGGGLFNNNDATVSDSTVSDNTATDGGDGGGVNNESVITIANSTITGNSLPGAGGGQGGGLFNDGSAEVADSTLSGNTASQPGEGAAIFSQGNGVLKLQQADSRALQSADQQPGDAEAPSQCLNCAQGQDTATLAGDILATPGGAPVGSECGGGGFTDGGYNVDDDGTCGLSGTSVSADSTIDDYLGSLSSNGGPTETIPLLAGTDAAPNPAQAAIPITFIPSGENSAACSQPDQRGFSRGSPCDMGAYSLTPPTMTSPDTAAFTVGQAGSFTVTTDNASITNFAEKGKLPSGLSLSSTGLLSGTPGSGTGGNYPIIVYASDGSPPVVTQQFTLTVDEAPSITSGQSTRFSLGANGEFPVAATGFPAASLSVIGPLPTGVTFTDGGNGTGMLSGTPAPGTGGTYALTVMAVNGTGSPVVGALNLTVDQSPAITSASQAAFALGLAGAFTITSSGSPTATLSLEGTLPTGLNFSDNGDGTATISGTPSRLTGDPVTLEVHATSPAGSVTAPLTIAVSSGHAWMAGRDGAVYPVGTAPSFGSMQAYSLNSPLVGLAATPTAGGYWLVAADGGVFACGNAKFFGSTGGIHLNQPIVGMAATPDGGGYWLVASDGGVFSFGDAKFFGSVATQGNALTQPVVGITSSADGRGYSLATAGGDVIPFGDGVAGGGVGAPSAPIVGISAP
jgi:hypothetical protein